MPQADCPPPADLESLFLGEGPADAVLAVEEHLLGCDACLETLKTLLGARDTLADLLRGPAPADPYLDSPVAADLVRGLQSLGASPVPFAGPAATDDGAPPGPAPADAEAATPSQQEAATQDGAAPGARDRTELTTFLAPPQAKGELGRLGKYRVLEVLGHGGMGVVYRAEDPQLKRVVALKAMLPGLAAAHGAGPRFLREAQAMAALKHDHVVTIYQVDEARGIPFLAMEFLEGEPLEARLRRDARLPLSEVLRIGREVAEGLAAAHARGLIHRDIKPGNVWLEGPHGRVKILDFGLARASAQEAAPAATALTQRGAIIGTPAYMAPEQARGDALDARSDLFSLGVILYRLCTGRTPFRGRDTIATLMAVGTHQPPPPCRLNPEAPAGLSALVMRLLEKDPDRRPTSAADVVQALRAMEQGRGGPAAPRRRRRAVRVAAVALLAALLGVTAAALIRITTDQGDYVIQTDDPDFTFQVRKDAVALKDTRAGRTYQVRVLRHDQATGEHELEVLDAGGDLAFRARTFTIRRGQQVALKAWFERKAPPRLAAWCATVASLPPDRQVAAVADKLKECNPGFDGEVTSREEGGVVAELQFRAYRVTDLAPLQALPGLAALKCTGTPDRRGMLDDLSPLKGMRLTELDVNFTNVTDLAPLRGMRLMRLRCEGTRVKDLAPLAGMPLAELDCSGTRVSDLAPLAGMDLRRLACNYTAVADLAPLRDMRPGSLCVGGTRVTDLSPLKDMRLNDLDCSDTKVKDLSPLKDMRLDALWCQETCITDLSPLKGMPLGEIFCDFKAERDTAILRSIKSLQKINDRPAAEFWQAVGNAAP